MGQGLSQSVMPWLLQTLKSEVWPMNPQSIYLSHLVTAWKGTTAVPAAPWLQTPSSCGVGSAPCGRISGRGRGGGAESPREPSNKNYPPCRQVSLYACAWVTGLCHDLLNVAISHLRRGLCLLCVDSDCHITMISMI